MIRFYHRLNNQPFLFILYFLIIILILGFTLTALIVTQPGLSGKLLKDAVINKGYTVMNWSPKLFDYLSIHYPKSAVLVPIYDQYDNVQGAFFLGNGNIEVKNPETKESYQESIQNLFVPMDRHTFDLLLLDVEEVETEIPASLHQHIQEFLNKRDQFYYSIHLFGYTRIYPPADEQWLAMMVNDQELLTYYETANVTFKKGSQVLLQFQHPFLSDEYPASKIKRFIHLIIVLLLAISFALTSILTLDSYQKRTWEMIKREVVHPGLGYLTFIMFMFLIANILQYSKGPLSGYQIAISLALGSLLIIPYLNSRFGLQFLSISSEHMGKDLFAAIILALLFQVVATLSIPTGIDVNSFGGLFWELFVQFAFVVLIQELYWRSLFQNTLERFTHRWVSLLITTLVMSLFYSGIAIWKESPLHTIEMFLIQPFTFLLIGFFYQRTRNILATSLLSVLLLELPKLFIIN